MKKSTWVIIGLSLCVVALSTALGVVLTQKKAETSPPFDKPWEKSFSLAITLPSPFVTKLYHYNPPESGILEEYSSPIFPGKVAFSKDWINTKINLPKLR